MICPYPSPLMLMLTLFRNLRLQSLELGRAAAAAMAAVVSVSQAREDAPDKKENFYFVKKYLKIHFKKIIQKIFFFDF